MKLPEADHTLSPFVPHCSSTPLFHLMDDRVYEQTHSYQTHCFSCLLPLYLLILSLSLSLSLSHTHTHWNWNSCGELDENGLGLGPRLMKRTLAESNSARFSKQMISPAWGQFHQHFTRSSYALRSQMLKKIVKSAWSFALLGPMCVKSLRKMLMKSTLGYHYYCHVLQLPSLQLQHIFLTCETITSPATFYIKNGYFS